jgi:hypothetical protein
MVMDGWLDTHSIDFIPDEGDTNECAAFEDLLSKYMGLQQMDASDDMEGMRGLLYDQLKSIPCILHSELRIAINILTMIFSMGIDTRDSKKEQEAFCEMLSKLVNNNVLGTDISPVQWVIPVTTKKEENGCL